VIITGIGSRETPQHICDLFVELGAEAKEREWWIRSGHAEGADYAFEMGAEERCIVYLPWRGFNKDRPVVGIPRSQEALSDDVLSIVYKHEPYAEKLSDGVKRIKSRNVFQILGEDLKSPSDLVVCWTPYGEVTGGTGLAIKIAQQFNVPVINVGDPDTEKNFDSILRGMIRS